MSAKTTKRPKAGLSVHRTNKRAVGKLARRASKRVAKAEWR